MKVRTPRRRRARPLLVATGMVAIQLAGCGDDTSPPVYGVQVQQPDAGPPDAPRLPDAVFGVIVRPDGKA